MHKFTHEPVQIYPFSEINVKNNSSSINNSDNESITQSISSMQSAIAEIEKKIDSLASKEELSIAVDSGRRSGIIEVLDDPQKHGLTYIEVLESTGATPHTDGWFFQPDLGWLWTNASVFPYIFRSEHDDKPSAWLYFKENSHPPHFFNFKTEEWEVVGK